MNLPSSLGIPASQNTAPVLEFQCLYTQDIRRKAQKRWQDGRLKFHTFNKRVMVYDERSNFIGDMHWQGNWEFAEGEDLRLERVGIEVQVCECIGKKEQDLTELLDKRVRDRENRVAAKAAIATPTRSYGQVVRTEVSATSVELPRPKPLKAVIGTPTGHYGRAIIPSVSPFEQRHPNLHDENMSDRPAKRHKRVESTTASGGYAQSLMGASLSLGTCKTLGTATIRYEPFRSSILTPNLKTIGKDGSDQKAPGVDQHNVSITPAVERPSIAQKRSSRRSPPRSSYASNLTGAVLSLGPTRTRPNNLKSVASKTASLSFVEAADHLPKNRSRTSLDTPLGVEELAIPSTEAEQSPIATKISQKSRKVAPATEIDPQEINSDKSSPVLDSTFATSARSHIRKSRSNLKIKPKPPRTLTMTTQQSRSISKPSSPLNNSRSNASKPMHAAPLTSQSAPLQGSYEIKSQNCLAHSISKTSPVSTSGHDIISISRPISAQPTSLREPTDKSISTLRIKARPPRKMMMLMGRPAALSHSNARSEPFENSTFTTSRQQHAVETQETTHNHLERMTNSIIETTASENQTTHPLDSEIDHLAINALLFSSREQKVFFGSDSSISNAQNLTQCGDRLQRRTIENQSGQTSIVGKSSPRFQEHEMDDLNDYSCVEDTAEKSSESKDGKTCQPLELVPVSTTAQPKQVYATTQEEFPIIENMRSSAATLTKKETPTDPLSGLTQAASPKPQDDIPSEEENMDSLSCSEAVSKGVGVSVTNRVQNTNIEQQLPGGNHYSKNDKIIRTINGVPETADKTFAEVELMKSNLGKARVVNPATRGRPISMAANKTADMLVQRANIFQRDMLPPPVLTSRSNPKRTIAREFTTNTLAAKLTSGGGPWSRESFDLFGTRKLPKEAGASGVSG